MGIGGISIWQLLIIALIIVLLFGTKKLRTLGTDLGGALKGFKSAMKEDEETPKDPEQLSNETEEGSSTTSTRAEHPQDK